MTIQSAYFFSLEPIVIALFFCFVFCLMLVGLAVLIVFPPKRNKTSANLPPVVRDAKGRFSR